MRDYSLVIPDPCTIIQRMLHADKIDEVSACSLHDTHAQEGIVPMFVRLWDMLPRLEQERLERFVNATLLNMDPAHGWVPFTELGMQAVGDLLRLQAAIAMSFYLT